MCDMESYAIPMADQYGRIYAGGAVTTQTRCKTHGWMFVPGQMAPERCPVGQIEKAVGDGVARIEAALRAKGV